MLLCPFRAEVARASLIDEQPHQIHLQVMIAAVPAIPIQQAIQNMLPVQVIFYCIDGGRELGTICGVRFVCSDRRHLRESILVL